MTYHLDFNSLDCDLSWKEVIEIAIEDRYPDVHLHLHTVEDDDFRRVLHNFNQRLKALESADNDNPTDITELEAKVTALTTRTTTLEVNMGATDARVTALTTAVTEYNEDVAAKLAQLRADIDALTAAGSENAAELEAVNASLTGLETVVGAGVSVVGDADADGVPAAPVEEDPVPLPEEPLPLPPVTPEEPVV